MVHSNCHTVRHVRDVIQRLGMRLILKRVIVQALLPPSHSRICVILIVNGRSWGGGGGREKGLWKRRREGIERGRELCERMMCGEGERKLEEILY